MRVLISYDISHGHTEVKQLLLETGFHDAWETPNKEVHNLPNTTLWHPNLSGPNQAKEVFYGIVSSLKEHVRVSHFISVEMGELISGMQGDSHS